MGSDITDGARKGRESLDQEMIRRMLLELGADDAGFVEVEREELASQRQDASALLPGARTFISIVFRLHPESLRTTIRSAAAAEYFHAERAGQETVRRALFKFTEMGVRAVAAPMGFPMEASRWAGKLWTVEHKAVAAAAGLGSMGTSRILLHPRFGAFVYLATILIDRQVGANGEPLDISPCDHCNLCVSVCPTGAISRDGQFNFINCMTHTYRDKLGGFIDWAENVAEGDGRFALRRRVTDVEQIAMWQSLAYHPVNKCDYCQAVCPAGQLQHPVYEQDKRSFTQQVVEPFQEMVETVYTPHGSDAADFVRRKFPHKRVKEVSHGIRPQSIASFIQALPHLFQPEASTGLSCVYHLNFTGEETGQWTVTVRDKTIKVLKGLQQTADVVVTADSRTWLGFLAKERNIVWAIITRKVKVTGGLERFKAFGALFPM
ncbi:MAG: SCP2 sterol-binding domain-containing protein [Nitrospinota bacterium]|nr:SCP2 sterol-binding domain-containing protein [Nitrospinota bacterium]